MYLEDLFEGLFSDLPEDREDADRSHVRDGCDYHAVDLAEKCHLASEEIGWYSFGNNEAGHSIHDNTLEVQTLVPSSRVRIGEV